MVNDVGVVNVDTLLVADTFHLVAPANQTLTDAHRRVTWDTHGRRDHTRPTRRGPPDGGGYAARERLTDTHHDVERPDRR